MTPEAWFAANDPRQFRNFVQTNLRKPSLYRPTNHRLRLFACASARQVWDLLPTDARSAIQASEGYAEGRIKLANLLAAAIRKRNKRLTAEEFALAAAQAASGLPEEVPEVIRHPNHLPFSPFDAAQDAARAVAIREIGPAPPGRPTTSEWQEAWNRAYLKAREIQADYFRDIFPPPRYRPKIGPQWITSTVLSLVRQMDDSGDYSIVPILADALQDAGCTDEAIMDSCRSAGNNHVRGNWVVDLIIGHICVS
jgi:hypothetical protein